MNTTLFSALLLTLGLVSCVAPAQPTYRDYDEYGSDYDRNQYNDYDDNYDDFDDQAYRNFYDDLSPHGRWMNYPEYGQVWAPNAGPGFMPYSTNGYWTYTNYGWTWVSDYAWGWGPFHYGRWFLDNRVGWLWRPGRQWAPAWVAWGQTNGYYGWAPLMPGININVNIGFNRFPRNYWTFVPSQHLYNRNWRGYAVRNNTTIINNNVTIINNYGDRNGRPNRGGRGSYWRGPQVQDVERYGNTRIRPMVIENTNRPGSTRVQGDRVTVYRPNTRPGNGGGTNRPSRNETSTNNGPVTRPGNRYERPDDQPVTRPGSTWERPATDRPNRSGETRQDNTWQNSPSRSNEDLNRTNTNPPTDGPVTRPNNGWERPRRSEATQPNVERPDWNSNSRNPERQPGMTRPGYGDQSRSAESRPQVARPEGRSDESNSRPMERPNWNRGGEQPSRSQAPSGEMRQQPSEPRQNAPAGRSDGGNQSSGDRPGRSRGPR